MRKFDLKKIMKNAWRRAKMAAKKFGGKKVEYFAESLKLAWAIAKTVATSDIVKADLCEYLKANGCNVISSEGEVVKAEKILHGVKYREYKTNDAFEKFDTVNGTYDSEAKTIDLRARITIPVPDQAEIDGKYSRDIVAEFFKHFLSVIGFYNASKFELVEA